MEILKNIFTLKPTDETIYTEFFTAPNRDQFDQVQKLHDFIIEKAKNPGPNDFFHLNAKVSWYANAENLFKQKNYRRAGLPYTTSI